MSALPGGVFQAQGAPENDVEIVELARFAVDEHNKKANGAVEFSRVVDVKKQVVAGTMYYITLEANAGGGNNKKKTVHEAKVWVKPWMNFKQLEDFKTLS